MLKPMAEKHPKNSLRTWLEIDKKAIRNNIAQFRKIISSKTKLMAVIKSNAYGHGLIDFARTVENKVDWFGVDSIVEGLKLRQKGLKGAILVLGYTLPARLPEAAQNDISLTSSSFELIKEISALKTRPKFHIKIDTGMHRQGFFLKDLPRLIKLLKLFKLSPEGIYTHLASAKDRLYPFYTLKQLKDFKKADAILKKAGFNNYLRHACATAGTLLYPNSHFDLVRVGIGLYGMFSTRETELQMTLPSWSPYGGSLEGRQNQKGLKVQLQPALSWKSIIGEVKNLESGSYVGYDLTEKVSKLSRVAIIPVGYWHGFDRGLSSIGEILIKGKRAKILGRVSMDMVVADISKIPGIKMGDEVIIIGKQGKEKITPEDIAQKIGTINYEVITRINPLIKRIYL